MRRPSRLCALGASAILFQPLTPYGRGVYRGSEAAVIAARFSKGINRFAKHRAFNTDFGTRFKQQLRQQTQRILRAQCK
jgi:hypothetical protein